MASRFQWSEVDPKVVRALLSRIARDADESRRLAKMSDDRLPTTARVNLGQPPHAKFTAELVDVALSVWLPIAPKIVVEELATLVQSGLGPAQRKQRLATKAERVAFLRERNLTTKFRDLVRKRFIAAHKVHVPTPKGPTRRQSALRPVHLLGEGAAAPHRLHRHQQESHAGLDQLLRQRKVTRAGVVVLPTGSGKTETAVTWLLEQMERDPTLRVLWVTTQQELLQQAASRFETWARCRPPGFERLGRVMHSNGYPVSQLANADLDVAFVTIQSLAGDLAKKRHSYLDQFLQRPTIVLVDEAHHCGAPTYTALFERLRDKKVKAVVGLTATPYPTSVLARQRFRDHFPTTIHMATAEELIAGRILARPVLHTVATAFQIEMTDVELRQADTNDLPASVLKRLDAEARNELVVDEYVANAVTWGKTLVYATNIANADHLHALLLQEKVNARVLHSAIVEDRNEVIDWFRRATGQAVLVSVGMLTEGIDLPDARTAFLSRPTASRVLLQQMIGRVLRGPLARGDAEANIVYFADLWRNFSDVLEPPEVLGRIVVPRSLKGTDPGTEIDHRGILFVDEAPELDPGALIDIRRQFDRAQTLPILPSRLVGYYRLPDRTVAVFEHQLDPLDDLLNWATEGSLQGTPFLSFFEDSPAPHPSPRSLRDLVEYVRVNGERPEFVSVDHAVGPTVAAERVLAAGAINDDERAAIIRATYRSTLASLAYPTMMHFEQAVEQELRSRRERRLVAERPLAPPTLPGLKKLPRFDRDLAPPTKDAVAACLRLLPAELSENLELPTVSWGNRASATNFAHWTIKLSGKARGRQSIRVNRVLRTTPKAVPDEVLAYLIYHELLHHLLPWQGHDAEFREYEARWPHATELDSFFDTLHERWDLGVARYRNDVGDAE